MSRLDSMIRRLEAQRACFETVKWAINERRGTILELGLGNGRTYDHLCSLFPDHQIYGFDRTLVAHPDCQPPADKLYLGEFAETLVTAATKLSRSAVLIHADIGSSDPNETDRTTSILADLIPPLMRPKGLVIADQPILHPQFATIELPRCVPPGRYYMYRGP